MTTIDDERDERRSGNKRMANSTPILVSLSLSLSLSLSRWCWFELLQHCGINIIGTRYTNNLKQTNTN